MTDTARLPRRSRWTKVPLVNQPRVADVNCQKCGHVVHYAACDTPLTWYQRLRHRRRSCGCTHWGG